MNRSMLMVAMFADCYIGKAAKFAKYSRKNGVSTFVIDFVPYVIDENPVDRQEFKKEEFISCLAKKCNAAVYLCDIQKNYKGGTLDDSIYPPVWIPLYCEHRECWEYLHTSSDWDRTAYCTIYKTPTGFEYREPYNREKTKQLVASLTSSVTFFFQDEFSQVQLDELAESLGVKIEVEESSQ